MTQNISLETLDSIFSNHIIFMLYNLFYIGQIDDLGTRVGLIYPDGGSTMECGTTFNEGASLMARCAVSLMRVPVAYLGQGVEPRAANHQLRDGNSH